MADSAVHIVVCGQVQGVFFRASAQAQALELGLTGWVRNLSNGTVEVHAEEPQGDSKAVRCEAVLQAFFNTVVALEVLHVLERGRTQIEEDPPLDTLKVDDGRRQEVDQREPKLDIREGNGVADELVVPVSPNCVVAPEVVGSRRIAVCITAEESKDELAATSNGEVLAGVDVEIG